MKKASEIIYDVVILTDERYVDPEETNTYVNNVLLEDGLVGEALQNRGYQVHRTNWDNPEFDWSTTRAVLFRTTWDYFERFEEFWEWIESIEGKTQLINSYDILKWNSDKHYLQDLEKARIRTIPTRFIEPGETRSLMQLIQEAQWDNQEVILKPAIAAGAHHTYRLNKENVHELEDTFTELIKKESMLLQPFQRNILTKGEISFMVFGGKYSHAILKKAKSGDFRVQDDFGGTVHDYTPTEDEIEFAEYVASKCAELPVYARVDVIWDNDNKLAVSELELIEPELWFRNSPNAAKLMAQSVIEALN